MLSSEIVEKYKENICPYCIHNKDSNYQECNIVIQINGEANCVNYKCDEYCRKRDEGNNGTG